MFGDVVSSMLVGYMVDLACISWVDPTNESGNCWFYNTDKLHIWIHLLPVMALVAASIAYFYAWKNEKRKENSVGSL